MAPYSPDRIPIIMVHGLRSTPLAWAQLTNELMGDPEIRRHYQIWHYLYPTGLPLLASAADFRDELESVRTLLDPDGSDFAMQNMVVIGHSMGGLLARTLVTDSGDAIWNSTLAIPMSALPPGLEQTPELRRLFYFQAKSYVKRVIFVAVPHRGSEVADSLLGRILARQVQLPPALQDLVANLQASMPQLFKPDDSARFDRGYHNGIRTLSPKDDALVAMAKLPVNSSIPFHSIMGDRGRGDGAKSSDGVVTYASAHLPGASSELIVPSNHSTHENPQALAEVKRILKLHLEQPTD
jgi:pimeloyl-ACP methyl ester carboxylesterase